mmetsp:Transcript_2186/g.4905  ORF Transcript_2186/g.4905 Transcript_2186/m.4905 type:complete len:217 (+) Transcript_2186:1416-2066(+)
MQLTVVAVVVFIIITTFRRVRALAFLSRASTAAHHAVFARAEPKQMLMRVWISPRATTPTPRHRRRRRRRGRHIQPCAVITARAVHRRLEPLPRRRLHVTKQPLRLSLRFHEALVQRHVRQVRLHREPLVHSLHFFDRLVHQRPSPRLPRANRARHRALPHCKRAPRQLRLHVHRAPVPHIQQPQVRHIVAMTLCHRRARFRRRRRRRCRRCSCCF